MCSRKNLLYKKQAHRTLYPWHEHQRHVAAEAELSGPCCIQLPGVVEWTGRKNRDKPIIAKLQDLKESCKTTHDTPL